MIGKKNPIHGLRKQKFYEKNSFVELIAAGPPVVAAIFGAFDAYQKENQILLIGLCLGCFWVIILAFVKIQIAKAKDQQEERNRGHDGLVAALHIIHKVVAHVGNIGGEKDERKLRVTFHRVEPPLEKSDHIEQIVPYVGGSGGGCGRTFSIRAGITGKAIRENALFVMQRASDKPEDYVKELIQKWGYTEADARQMQQDRFSAIAVPVSGKGNDVLGVLYLDSSERNFFNGKKMRETVVSACAGLANYIGERYA